MKASKLQTTVMTLAWYMYVTLKPAADRIPRDIKVYPFHKYFHSTQGSMHFLHDNAVEYKLHQNMTKEELTY
jgi:hypothetical protein